MNKKILVAVDGSVYSFNALRYISRLFTDLEDIHVDLLCVVPTGTMMQGREWMDELDIMCTIGPQARGRLRKSKRFMEEAVLQLGRRGIASSQLTTTVKLARSGAAADIMFAAKKGLYDALLIGRRGISKVEELFMGSVSSSITESCCDIPIWIVDGKVHSRRFLMPVDGTFHSLKAADHLGFILAGNPYAEITLFHLTPLLGSQRKLQNRHNLCERWGKDWCDQHLDKEDSIYHAPEQMLIDRGVFPEKIKRHGISLGIGATRHIIRHSELDDFGTIVIGRRGKSDRSDIIKGVSDKVLQAAKHVAIWVVG